MISIIVPVFNEKTSLPNFLRRLAKLPGSFEAIIVDGQSADGTFSIAEQEALPHWTVVTVPKGRSRQMNAGATQAKGDALLFLHADTTLPDEALEAIEDALRDSRVKGGRFKVKLDNPRIPFRIIGEMINIRDALFGGFTGDQAIFVRRESFFDIGGFREIDICEDLDFASRLKKTGVVVQLPNKVTTSARRWEKKGVVRTVILMWIVRILFYMRVSPRVLARMYADLR